MYVKLDNLTPSYLDNWCVFKDSYESCNSADVVIFWVVPKIYSMSCLVFETKLLVTLLSSTLKSECKNLFRLALSLTVCWAFQDAVVPNT